MNSTLSESEKNELLSQFKVTVQDVNDETALNFLDLSGWDLGIALETFYDHQDEKATGSFSQDNVAESAQQPWPSSTNNTGSGQRSGFRSIADLSNDDKEEPEGQDIYAGGEKSGTSIRYPGIPENVNSLLGGLFERMNQPRPQNDSEEEEEEEEENAQPKPKYFTGAGSRIGDETVPESSFPSIPGAFPGSSQDQPQPSSSNELVVRELKLWRNGVSLDDGPLLSYETPQAVRFLEAVKRGVAPIDLLNVQPGQRVDLRVHQNLEEEFKAPPVEKKPFQGSGNRLGSIVPSMASVPSTSPAAQPDAPTIEVNPSLPQTSIQIRLSNGSRVVAKFNHTHTVGDLYNFVQRSIGNTQPFILQTTFPMKTLEDKNMTIVDAKLLNSAVIQKNV